MNRITFRACCDLCRLHGNVGLWNVWLPLAWSIVMAYHANSGVSLASASWRAIFYLPLTLGVKSLILTIDDILDHDVDRLVERTKLRPIPRGDITVHQALLFAFCQLIVGILSAQYFLGNVAWRISATTWPLFFIYPTCKRWTHLAPIPLGIMVNIGIFMGWCDLLNTDADWSTLMPIFIGGCLWTCTYETVYQHQDKIDDVGIGLHSPALLFGRHTTVVCTLTAIGFCSSLAYGAWINQHGIIFYIFMMVAAYRIFSTLLRMDLDEPDQCKAFFLGSPLVSSIIFAGFVVDAVIFRFFHNVPL